jgi:hypothetical protein
MDYNIVLTSTPEQVQKSIVVFQQLIIRQQKLNQEINVLYNDLFVQISSLPRSDNLDLPRSTTISTSLFGMV